MGLSVAVALAAGAFLGWLMARAHPTLNLARPHHAEPATAAEPRKDAPTLPARSANPLNRAVRTAQNREPAIPWPEQDKAVASKLAALQGKTGKKPNILWLIVDDMGFGDPGCYGGVSPSGRPRPTSTGWPARGCA